ncbi:MAG: 5-bromo-4-chloroindolyl phosphate hydrolysis family protein, partial [Gammaproteobacteria bacterium]|nr:5-bromo-4-chloroindolyl phosphate hydrolysis family protein [Gammaproteobacteria bacterium]
LSIMSESLSGIRRKPKLYTRKPIAIAYRGALLFILPLPLLGSILVALARGHLASVLFSSLGLALCLAGAFAIRRGLARERAYQRKKVALPPKVPLKLIGALLVALAVFFIALMAANHSFPIAVCFSIGAFVGCYFAYGLDPRTEKVVAAGSHGYTTAEVVEALEEAHERVTGIEQANDRIKNPELNERLRRITDSARKILEVIEEDPRDLRRARKFLNTYLEGTQKVTQGYARSVELAESTILKENFRKVLATVEDVFAEQYEKLLENDVLDLDVQIEVLRLQLEREGVV